MKSSGFLEADCSTVTTILEQQEMEIKSELELFDALQAWTNTEARRQGKQKFFYYIIQETSIL